MRLLGLMLEGGVIISAQVDEWMKIAALVFSAGAQERESFLMDTGFKLREIENFSRSLQSELTQYWPGIMEGKSRAPLDDSKSLIDSGSRFEVIGKTISGDIIIALKDETLEMISSLISRAMLVLGPEELQTLSTVEYDNAEEILGKIEELQRLCREL
jgi:hypothetical protein